MTIRPPSIRNVLLILGNSFILSTSLLQADEPGSSPGATTLTEKPTHQVTPKSSSTPMDYFRAGSIMAAITSWQYNADQYDHLQDKYGEAKQMLIKASATPEILKAWDTYTGITVPLPFNKDFDSWTQAQQNAWTKTSVYTKKQKDPWLGADNTVPCFFYYLGRQSMMFFYYYPTEIFQNNNTLDSQIDSIKTVLSDFVWLRDDHPDQFKLLTPEVQGAIKQMASLNPKASDPMGNGLTQDDLKALQGYAGTIVNAGKSGTLLK